MKTAFTLLVIVIAVLSCGCTAAVPAAVPAPASHSPGEQATDIAIPRLAGNWSGSAEGVTGGIFYEGGTNVRMVVVGQQDRLFAGKIVVTEKGTTNQHGFAGVIGRDGRTIAIAEEDGGYSSGTIIGDNEIELVYLRDGPSFGVAIDTLRRE
jgi:hypothetical protein